MTDDNGMLRDDRGRARPCHHLELCTLENCWVCPVCDTVTIRTTLSAARQELTAMVEADHASTSVLNRALSYICT